MTDIFQKWGTIYSRVNSQSLNDPCPPYCPSPHVYQGLQKDWTEPIDGSRSLLFFILFSPLIVSLNYSQLLVGHREENNPKDTLMMAHAYHR